MITISLWQPWASALFAPASDGGLHAIKLHETRSWPLPKHHVQQWLGIHAAKRDTPETREAWDFLVGQSATFRAAFDRIGAGSYAALPRGAVIGKIMFGPPGETERYSGIKDMTLLWGDYTAGRWAWPVVQFKRFAEPIPCIGRQGFFDVPELDLANVTDEPRAGTEK